MEGGSTLQRQTTVIIITGGRLGNPDPQLDRCAWTFNRQAAYVAHQHGFIVFEREEIERRLLFKSEYNEEHRTIKPDLHLANPAPQIVATSLLGMVSCLAKNVTNSVASLQPFHVFRRRHFEHEIPV